MKYLILITLIFSSTAFACPDLSGKYNECRSTGYESGSMNMIVTQRIENGVTFYNIETTLNETHERVFQELIADGIPQVAEITDPETGKSVKLILEVGCKDNSLYIINSLTMDDYVASEVRSVITKSGNTLTLIAKGESMGETIDDTLICE